MKYKIIFDNGKPYEDTANTTQELKDKLKKFYLDNNEHDAYFNATIYNSKNEDISETQFIKELIEEIIQNEI